MKKLLIPCLLSLLAVGSMMEGRCGSCCRTEKTCPETCEPAPVCYKMVRKEVPARKVCEKICHYECPADTIREECQ